MRDKEPDTMQRLRSFDVSSAVTSVMHTHTIANVLDQGFFVAVGDGSGVLEPGVVVPAPTVGAGVGISTAK